ncbi:MAG: DegV family protein [Oscillospiraceae bacterium]
MTTNYQILTDSSCDLPASLARTLGVSYAPLRVQFQGAEYENFLDGDPRSRLEMKAFYKTLRTGAPTSTTAVNPEGWSTLMAPILAAGQDLSDSGFLLRPQLHLCQPPSWLRQELAPQYPAELIRVVDTLCASMGQGLLVYHAVQRQQAGESLAQVADFVEATKLHLCHWFTVDDLMFLKRGGRISAATAVVGTMLKIKPVLHVDDLGHLVNVSKARGRRASIDAMAAKVGQTGIDPGNQVFFISHGDCLGDAEYLADLLRRTYHPKDVVISYVGPVIGSHSGPGTLALFFLGTQR